jgi:6-phospho-3-hexuloisomerase
VDGSEFDNVLDTLREPDHRWFVTGQGRSGLVASMFAMRLMHLGMQVHLVGEVTAPAIRNGDWIMIVSGSGSTPISLSYANTAKNERAHVLAVTSDPRSHLSQISECTLTIPVVDSPQIGGSAFEQGALLVLDALIVGLALDDPEAKVKMAELHTNLQ